MAAGGVNGVEVANIKNIDGVTVSGGAQETGWVETYSIDFADYDSGGTMSTDDTIAIDGVTWTAQAIKGTTEITSGTGLEVEPLTGGEIWSNTDCPWLYADVADLVGGTVSEEDQVVFQWVQDTPVVQTVAYQQCGGGIWDGVAMDSDHERGMVSWHAYRHGALATQSVVRPMRGYQDYNSGAFTVTATGQPNSFEMFFCYMGQLGIFSTSALGVTTLVDPLVADHIRVYGTNAAPGGSPTGNFSTTNWIIDQQPVGGDTSSIPAATSKFFLFAGWNSTNSIDYRGVFTKFRVFRQRGG